MTREQFDVAVLGSGLASSILATILAKHGHSVVMLEANSHPRFAIGESVVPEFGALCNLLSDLFDVPEFAKLSSFPKIKESVSANCGIKRNFTFLQHSEAEEPSDLDWSQFQTMTYPVGPDTHIYRPDIDAWLAAQAVKYGVDYRERTPVEDIELRDDGVTIRAGGKHLDARFIVDGTGFRSLIADKLKLRQEPDFATNTRSIFTHMVGVQSINHVIKSDHRPPVPSPPEQGTLHHHFDGGWFWVIPFDNHSQAVNPVCSVGLTLDRERYPDNDLDAEEEFSSFVRRFPVIARQFSEAKAVRSWIKSRRLQYQSSKTVGPRWCLLPHTAGFIDPLFSGGMVLSLLGVRQIASALLEALPSDDPSPRGLKAYEENAVANARYLDKVIHGAYIAFRSPQLFDTWYRFWAVGNYHASAATIALNMRFLQTGDKRTFNCLDDVPYRYSLGGDNPSMHKLVEDGYDIMLRLERREVDAESAQAQLFELLKQQKWIPPQFHVAEPQRRYLASFTVFPLLSMIFWGKRRAPKEFRKVYYDVGPVYMTELARYLWRVGKRNTSAFLNAVKAAHFSRGRI
ncbi:MAG: FADH2 O2-dependent halogenase [Planctomycetota bacterium]|jgi:FADH2 O2-dependent halogenase